MKKTMTITAFNRPGYLEQMLRDAGSMAVLFHAAMVRWTESIADLRAVADPGRMGLGDLEGIFGGVLNYSRSSLFTLGRHTSVGIR